MPFEFTKDNRKKADDLLARYEQKQAALLPLLHLAQEQHGWIAPEVEAGIAAYLGLPVVKVHEVVSFYTMFHKRPVGRYHIQVCTNLTCSLLNADGIVAHLEKRLKVPLAGTTPDGRFTLNQVECLCACELAPMMQVNDRFYGPLTPEKVDEILDRCP